MDNPMDMQEQGMEESPTGALEGGGMQQPQQQGNRGGEDARLQQQVEAYASGMLQMIHDKKSREQVYSMLKSAPPEESIPRTALTINTQMESALDKRGSKPPLPIIFAAGTILVQELIGITNEGNLSKQPIDDKRAQGILEKSYQMYIENGLKKKTLDPVELQQLVEPLMSEQQRGAGVGAAEQLGLPPAPGQRAAMETYANQRVSQVERQMSTKMAGKQRVGALQKGMQGGQR